MKCISRLPFLLATALLTGGCMTEGPFPSLAQRDVERQPVGEPVRVMPDVPADPSLRATIGELVALARRGDQAFETAFVPAAAAARAAGATGSDSWIIAQEQVSRAEAARAGTMQSLGDLDRLALERSNLPTSPEDQAELNAAIDLVEGLALDQHSRLDSLKALIVR
ncbi:MAG TPA: hypothetical protein VFO69_12230 [Allosphingosinicella sp.]|nr:hypothetical protein [Allosphingosinicella sp.]